MRKSGLTGDEAYVLAKRWKTTEDLDPIKKEIGQLKSDIADETSRATAVENTKADKTALARTDMSLDALWKLNQGVSYEFQTDDTVAYQKTIPSGAKLASVEKIGGRTLVWNQKIGNVFNCYDQNQGSVTVNDNICEVTQLVDALDTNYASGITLPNNIEYFEGHKYLFKIDIYTPYNCYAIAEIMNNYPDVIENTSIVADKWNPLYVMFTGIKIAKEPLVYLTLKDVGAKKGDIYKIKNWNIFDLTQMFGAGNEPSTVEEFEAMFPADYYPYNEGELLSMGVNEIVEQGKNLLNYDAWKGLPIARGTAVFEKNSFTLTATENDCYTEPSLKAGFPDDAKIEISEGETVTLSWESSADIDGIIYIFPNGVADGMVYGNNHSVKVLTYTATRGVKFITFRFGVSNAGNTISYKNIQIEKKAKATSYEPYHRTTHAIPQSILQLDGYGESGNFVDFAEKKYHKGDRTIDISDIIGDTFQEPLEVEAGGALIFKNSHGDDYRIPVPSSEEYVISLAEVAK